MYTRDEIEGMAERRFPSMKKVGRIHDDTTDFFKVEYGDVIRLGEKPYLVRHNAKEGRFGLDDEIKFWVKRSIDLETGERKIIKLEFYEKFETSVGGFKFQCFRSPQKEARILDLTGDHPHFMHGLWEEDSAGNIVRVIDHIYGKSLHTYVNNLDVSHETYFSEYFPAILKQYVACVEAIRYLHQHNLKHGDIRRDHIFMDRETGYYRWIDFDFNYLHKENIYSYDLFGLGNILIFVAGKGDILIQELTGKPGLNLQPEDVNIVFKNRLANLKKVYPYLPERLNRILLHFSAGAEIFYENTRQLLDDLEEALTMLP